MLHSPIYNIQYTSLYLYYFINLDIIMVLFFSLFFFLINPFWLKNKTLSGPVEAIYSWSDFILQKVLKVGTDLDQTVCWSENLFFVYDPSGS